MPFDGTHFSAPPAIDTGIFPLWSKHGFRLWIKARFRPEGRVRARPEVLRAPSHGDRDAAVVQLLRDARMLIADPGDWTRAHLPVAAWAALRGWGIARRGKPARRSEPGVVGARAVDQNCAVARLYQCRGDERSLVARRGRARL